MKLGDITVGWSVLVLTASLLVAGAAPVQAASQTWFLTDAAGVDGEDEMQKGSGNGAGTRTISDTSTNIWVADEQATIDVNFGSGAGNPWSLTLGGDFSTGTQGATWIVGAYDPDGGGFTAADGDEAQIPQGGPPADFTADTDFTLPTGDYLAIRITDNFDTTSTTVDVSGTTESPSSLTSPDSDPGYPAWELASIALLGVGLVVAIGYIRRRQG